MSIAKTALLIRNVELHSTACVDVRILDGVVAAIAPVLAAAPDDTVIDGNGGALLPGLHDHHLHFMAFAASLDSLQCGPPYVDDEAVLERVLRERAALMREGWTREVPIRKAQMRKDAIREEAIHEEAVREEPTRWLRGIGYHESVAGAIDRRWLDRIVPDIPVRVQQRSGRLWILNSCALQRLGDLRDSPLEHRDGEFTGRLYDADGWLRERIGRQLPDVRRASRQLAALGITGFTDTTPGNDRAALADFDRLQREGVILQRVVLMGDASLDDSFAAHDPSALLCVGAAKVHLHDSALPDFDVLCSRMSASHAVGRPVAVHCVTLTELVFALGAFEDAGTIAGDRIEHAAIAPPDLVERMAVLQLTVVTQPNFIGERGDAYLRDVDAADQPWLYRLRGFLDAGIRLAAGSDAPFGAADPWAAVRDARMRRTRDGRVIAAGEALSCDEALALFAGDPLRPGAGRLQIETGDRADLCLLDRSWREWRHNPAAATVQLTVLNGVPIASMV